MELKRDEAVVFLRLAILLIVPYGIETKKSLLKLMLISLLIVPYGIETPLGAMNANYKVTFNRTLWN